VPLCDADLPIYSVLVPLHKEEVVLPGLIASIERLDYPRAKLDVMLLIEDGDEQTRRGLDALPLPDWIRRVTVPCGEPRTKPRALNIGLALARGDYAVVYDAEDRPAPRQLKDALDRFRASPPETAVVQACLTIDPRQPGFLVDQCRMEYAG